MSFNRPLGKRRAPYVAPRMPTEADILYHGFIAEGKDPKDAAKMAQDKTGLSVVTGKRMKTRGFGAIQR
jgi:hypothetical protein